MRAREADEDPPGEGTGGRRQVLGRLEERVRTRQVLVADEVRQPGVDGRPEDAGREPGGGRERDDLARARRERQRGEDAEPGEIGGDHQPAAREAVDERAEDEPDGDRRQEVGDQERAHPSARMGAVVDVDRQRDEGEPRAEAGAEGREEERPEARRAREELEPRADHGTEATRSRRRASASAKNAFSSGVPTVTRIALGAPKPASGRTITPSRRSSSKTIRASPPTSA